MREPVYALVMLISSASHILYGAAIDYGWLSLRAAIAVAAGVCAAVAMVWSVGVVRYRAS